MANLGMKDSFDFDEETVDAQVTKESPGNFALGFVNDAKAFVVFYVGRADADLNKEIKKHIGEDVKYRRFKYSYAASPKEAFEKECKNYHDFGGDRKKLRNTKHPESPEKSDWVCPVCNKVV